MAWVTTLKPLKRQPGTGAPGLLPSLFSSQMLDQCYARMWIFSYYLQEPTMRDLQDYQLGTRKPISAYMAAKREIVFQQVITPGSRMMLKVLILRP